ncbi:MAG: hypothetical protein OXU69_12945 [Gemmatimonadota bacterium]|nr:hypothetical protein [Gemmatimonadota bacterium]MDE2985606.1 hypothetical protein [Gemmatimonadota bacterium]
MRSGHRSAHAWVVIASAILAAVVLTLGWIVRARRPVPEPLARAGSAAAEAGPGVDRVEPASPEASS